jgi:hypothetical protein
VAEAGLDAFRISQLLDGKISKSVDIFILRRLTKLWRSCVHLGAFLNIEDLDWTGENTVFRLKIGCWDLYRIISGYQG